jgi:hypothetical protein
LKIVKSNFNCDLNEISTKQDSRPIIDIFQKEIKDFSKYKLAKLFLKWTRDHNALDLTAEEISQWVSLIELINKALN